MYSAVGDFVRMGNTAKDPYHSMIVQETVNIVVSMNRCDSAVKGSYLAT